MRAWMTSMVMAGLLTLGSCDKDTGITIAVVPKGTTHSFWKSVHAGADEAGAELKVNVDWKGPVNEGDRAAQINIVETFATDSNIKALVLAPLDDTALLQPVQEAVAKKMPVVIFDSALKGEVGKDFVSFVATDNRAGGAIGGQQLAKLLGGKGKVVLLRYMEGSASTMEREAGFLDVMHQNPGIQIIVENRYAGDTAARAQEQAMNMLDQLKQADGIFCSNESATFGMLRALEQGGVVGKAKFVGFDASKDLIDALRDGKIDALVAQNPRKMGYEAVKAAVAAVRGQHVEPRIDTGVRLLTKGDLDLPEVKKLLGE